MTNEDFRARYLRERVLTASPAQRVVMLYDRLSLDLARAGDDAVPDPVQHVDHAVSIVAELRSSLDVTAGGPADNLAALYTYLLRELLAVRGGERARLAGCVQIVETLRAAWTKVAAEQLAAAVPAAAGAWVG
jgi:flagellar protein FliS